MTDNKTNKNKENFLKTSLRSKSDRSEVELFNYEAYEARRGSSKFKEDFPIGAFFASLPILFFGGLIMYLLGMLIYEFIFKNIL